MTSHKPFDWVVRTGIRTADDHAPSIKATLIERTQVGWDVDVWLVMREDGQQEEWATNAFTKYIPPPVLTQADLGNHIDFEAMKPELQLGDRVKHATLGEGRIITEQERDALNFDQHPIDRETGLALVKLDRMARGLRDGVVVTHAAIALNLLTKIREAPQPACGLCFEYKDETLICDRPDDHDIHGQRHPREWVAEHEAAKRLHAVDCIVGNEDHLDAEQCAAVRAAIFGLAKVDPQSVSDEEWHYAALCAEEIHRVRTTSDPDAEIVVEIGPNDLPGVAEVWGCTVVRYDKAANWLPRAYARYADDSTVDPQQNDTLRSRLSDMIVIRAQECRMLIAEDILAVLHEQFDSKAHDIATLLYAWKNDDIKTSAETAHRLRSLLFDSSASLADTSKDT